MMQRVGAAWRLVLWVGLAAWPAAGALLGCGSAHAPQVDSETHFLSRCTDACGGGLSCVCGVCTLECAASSECSELAAGARCLSRSASAAAMCGAEAPARVCDVQCERDSDCAALGAEHACSAGLCREPGGPGATAEALPYARSGERIKALHYVADGAILYRGLHDETLDIACEFAPDERGGGLHCIPSAARGVIYLDSACEQPAVAEQAADAASELRLTQGDWLSGLPSGPAPTCVSAPPAPARAIYRVGELAFEGGIDAIGKTLPEVYALDDGKCAPTAPQLGLLLPNLYRLEPADRDQLVAGTASTIDVGGGLAVRRVSAEDGAELTLGVLGRGGEPCSLQAGGVCVPEPVADQSGGFFLDGECTNGAFFAPATVACGAQPLGVRLVGDEAHVYELQATHRVFFMNLTSGAPPRCEAFAIDTDEVFVPLAEVTDSFPRARVVQTGTGALHTTQLVAPGDEGAGDTIAAVLEPGTAFTDARGDTCLPRAAADGTTRCVAERVQVMEVGFWRDANCNERLFTAVDANEAVENLLLVNDGVAIGSGPIDRLWRVEPYSGETYQVSETRCVPATSPAEIALLARGEELPLSRLPRITAAEL